MTVKDGAGALIGRVFAVAAELQRGKTLTSKDAADLFRLEEPAGRPYLDAAIEHLGAEEVRKAGKRAVRLSRTLSERPSAEMAIAVAFSGSLARLFDASAVGTGMHAALRYFVEGTGDPDAYDSVHRKFFFVRQGGEMMLPERAADLQLAAQAVMSQNVLKVAYQSFDGEVSEYNVDPLSIAVYDHQLYILSRKPDGKIHPLRFSRCVRLRVLKEKFAYPPVSEFEPSKLFQHSFGIWLQPDAPVERIRVVLDRRWSVFARSHRWADDQQVFEREDGILVEFHVRVCEELVMWALGFGREIRILEPRNLRERVAARTHSP